MNLDHLEENIASADLHLDAETKTTLDHLGLLAVSCGWIRPFVEPCT